MKEEYLNKMKNDKKFIKMYIFKKVDNIEINVIVNRPKFQIIQKFRQDDRDALILK